MGFAEVTGEFSQTTTKNTGKKCPYLLHGTEILMVKINPANKHLGWSWNPVNNEIFTNLNWCRMSSIKSIYLHLDKQFGTCRSKFQVTWSIWDIANFPSTTFHMTPLVFWGGPALKKFRGVYKFFKTRQTHVAKMTKTLWDEWDGNPYGKDMLLKAFETTIFFPVTHSNSRFRICWLSNNFWHPCTIQPVDLITVVKKMQVLRLDGLRRGRSAFLGWFLVGFWQTPGDGEVRIIREL